MAIPCPFASSSHYDEPEGILHIVCRGLLESGSHPFPREDMTLARYYARAGGDRALIASVAAELRTRWDPHGDFQAPDGEYSAESHALAILGILATGGDTAAVKGYLRRAEAAALGEPRTTSQERGAMAEGIWRAMVDTAVRISNAAGESNPTT